MLGIFRTGSGNIHSSGSHLLLSEHPETDVERVGFGRLQTCWVDPSIISVLSGLDFGDIPRDWLGHFDIHHFTGIGCDQRHYADEFSVCCSLNFE